MSGDASWQQGFVAAAVLAAAFALPIVPWTAHVSSVEGRFVPISTGGGKALFIGTYVPGNGLHLDVKRVLIKRYQGRENLSATELSRTVDDAAAEPRRAPLPRPAARRRAAAHRPPERRALHHDQPLDFAAMVAGKMWHMWHGSGAAGRSTWGNVFQFMVLALALAGLALLTLRRRWEVLPIGALLLGVTVVGGLLLAGTRRNVTLMPLVMALASVAVAMAVQRIWRRLPSRYLAPPCES